MKTIIKIKIIKRHANINTRMTYRSAKCNHEVNQ